MVVGQIFKNLQELQQSWIQQRIDGSFCGNKTIGVCSIYLGPQYSWNNILNWNHHVNPFLIVCGVGGRIKDTSEKEGFKHKYHQDLSQNTAIYKLFKLVSN